MTVLADIERMIAEYEPIPDPFNGATSLVLAPGLMRALAPHIETWARSPLMGKCPEIEVRHTLPDGYGIGFRQWRKGDDPEIEIMGSVMVWFCGPKLADNG